jgi:hypothetical protein
MFDIDVAAQPIGINPMARANIRAARARLGITQASVARRMRQLGYRWYAQTCGLVERNERPLLADELAALALCLETTQDVLALPPPNVTLVSFGEHQIPAQRLSIVDDSVSWDGDDLKVAPPTITYRSLELRIAREPDPQARARLETYADDLRQWARSGREEGTQADPGAQDIPVRRPDDDS